MIARPSLPRFTGPFKSFTVSISTDREKGTESRFLVYSQGSRVKVLEYLWLKFLWDELTKEEFQLFILAPETLNSEIKVAALRALLIIGKKELRTRLNKMEKFLMLKTSSKERYQGYKRLNVEIHRITRNLPKVRKFSGYVRSLSATGSKRSGGPRELEPLAINEYDYDEKIVDWYTLLTVGEIEFLGFPVDVKSP